MKVTAQQLRARKQTGPKITMLTCYDYPTARIEDRCGIDVLLVGDSVGTNMLGYTDVSQVTVSDMLHHVKAVARGAARAFVLCDMPYHSFETASAALENARMFMAGGADGVKMEGERQKLEQIRAVSAAGIPVCAHIGYKPQLDGTRASVQGKDVARARELLDVASEIAGAGASMVVLELIPERLAAEITARLSIPTIGIGAGRYCDGQVQVICDIAGFSERVFHHAKVYDTLADRYAQAISCYIAEVRDGIFPGEKNSAHLPDEVYQSIVGYGTGRKG